MTLEELDDKMMTLEELDDKIREWDLRLPTGATPESAARFSYIYDQLQYHAEHEWSVYLPADNPEFSSNYLERLAAWIGNVADEADQQLLLKYAPQISFFSHTDFRALYRAAMNREVTRWVASQVSATLTGFSGKAFDVCVRGEILRRTWFCPVTDSLDINEFYKVNNLVGPGHRPTFATLQKLAEDAGSPNAQLAENLRYYMANEEPSLERLVLLEDVVGSSAQCIDAVRWAADNVGKPVLFIPLILCPNGVTPLQDAQDASGGKLTVRPIIELDQADIVVRDHPAGVGWPIAEALSKFVVDNNNRISPNRSPFGYRDTGCSIVTFSNTPDNTLTLVHHKRPNGDWSPLFPRVDRE